MTGTLYVINGPSSCGKTSACGALQNLLPNPSVLLGMDIYHLAIPPAKLDMANIDTEYFSLNSYTKNDKPYTEIMHGPNLLALNPPRFKANCQFLEAGIDVVSDEVFWREELLLQFLEGYKGQRVFIFGLHVNDAEGERRELGRAGSEESFGDNTRPLGMNRASEEKAHLLMEYDLELDVSELSIEQTGQALFDELNKGLQATAFEKLLAKYDI